MNSARADELTARGTAAAGGGRSIISSRGVFALITATSLGLLGYGFYLQYFQDLVPCPLCMLQRACFVAAALVAGIGAIHGAGRIGSRVYAGLLALVSVTGAGIAARQVWLQHLPADQVPECGPGFDFMLDVYPLMQVITESLKGSGDCAEVDWTFLSFSIAEWSLACFAAFTAAAAAAAFLRAR